MAAPTAATAVTSSVLRQTTGVMRAAYVVVAEREVGQQDDGDRVGDEPQALAQRDADRVEADAGGVDEEQDR